VLSLPFSLVGGISFLDVLDYELSVGVSFIARAGVSAETGVIMLTSLDQAFKDKQRQGQMDSLADLKDALFKGGSAIEKRTQDRITRWMAKVLDLWGYNERMPG